jgi:hypothetical protein
MRTPTQPAAPPSLGLSAPTHPCPPQPPTGKVFNNQSSLPVAVDYFELANASYPFFNAYIAQAVPAKPDPGATIKVTVGIRNDGLADGKVRGWAGPGWAGLGRAGPGWAGLGRAGPGWAGLGRAGPGWAGLGRAEPGRAGPGGEAKGGMQGARALCISTGYGEKQASPLQWASGLSCCPYISHSPGYASAGLGGGGRADNRALLAFHNPSMLSRPPPCVLTPLPPFPRRQIGSLAVYNDDIVAKGQPTYLPSGQCQFANATVITPASTDIIAAGKEARITVEVPAVSTADVWRVLLVEPDANCTIASPEPGVRFTWPGYKYYQTKPAK